MWSALSSALLCCLVSPQIKDKMEVAVRTEAQASTQLVTLDGKDYTVDQAMELMVTLSREKQYPVALAIRRGLEGVKDKLNNVTLKLVNIVEEGNLWQGHTYRDVYKDEWKVERETAASLKKGQIKL